MLDTFRAGQMLLQQKDAELAMARADAADSDRAATGAAAAEGAMAARLAEAEAEAARAVAGAAELAQNAIRAVQVILPAQDPDSVEYVSSAWPC